MLLKKKDPYKDSLLGYSLFLTLEYIIVSLLLVFFGEIILFQ